MKVKEDSFCICCQFGSREYYAIPRSLIINKIPIKLITDIWISQNIPIPFLKNRFSRRYHKQIPDSSVKCFNRKFLTSQLLTRNRGSDELVFQKLISKWLLQEFHSQNNFSIISYSYNSERIFQTGKELGSKNLLAQINPGPAEADLIKEAFLEEFGNTFSPDLPDERYWDRWREECELSDRIIVNSKWSRDLLIDDGIKGEKIRIIPLAYERQNDTGFVKEFPLQFGKSRPLRILFLGTVSIRKGFHILKKAMASLKNEPVLLDVAGHLKGPEELLERLPVNIRFHGRKTGREKDDLFKKADVFILPTLSDGFALTQLEAQFWKLPLIVSSRCGRVIEDGKNGLVMNSINENTISDSIKSILDQPDQLEKYSNNSINIKDYSLKSIGEKWAELISDVN